MTASHSGSRFSLRGLIIGVLLCVGVGLVAPYWAVFTNNGVGFAPASPGAILFLMVTVLASAVVGLISRRLSLPKADLVLIFCMLLVAITVPTWGTMFFLIGTMVYPYYFATSENRFADLLHPHIPSWIVPQDVQAIKDYYEGLPKGGRIPWEAWVEPMGHWLALTTVMGFMLICMSAILQAITVPLLLVVSLIFFTLVARVVTTAGVATARSPIVPAFFIISGLGTSILGAKGLVALNFTFIWQGESQLSAMVATSNGLKLAERIPGPKGRLFWGLMLALVVTFLASAWMTLKLGYTYGAINLNLLNWVGAHGWPSLGAKIADMPDANMRGWLFRGIGAAVEGFLMFAQHWWHWWSLHPVGFTIAVGWLTSKLWFPALVAWVIKLTILFFWGPRMFQAMRPFFLGLIMGEIAVGGIWARSFRSRAKPGAGSPSSDILWPVNPGNKPRRCASNLIIYWYTNRWSLPLLLSHSAFRRSSHVRLPSDLDRPDYRRHGRAREASRFSTCESTCNRNDGRLSGVGTLKRLPRNPTPWLRKNAATPFVIVWDCDAAEEADNLGGELPVAAKVTPFAFRRRQDNAVAWKGIENNYDEEILKPFSIKKVEHDGTLRGYVFPKDRKTKFAKHVQECGTLEYGSIRVFQRRNVSTAVPEPLLFL